MNQNNDHQEVDDQYTLDTDSTDYHHCIVDCRGTLKMPLNIFQDCMIDHYHIELKRIALNYQVVLLTISLKVT